MLPEPNFPVRPEEFVGRRRQIETFCQALQQGLEAGRTASFAILGDWGIGKSSLLLKFAALSSQPSFAMLPVFISASGDVGDYLRLAENLLDKFTDALLAVPTMQALLRVELRNWRLKRVNLGGFALERESPRLFLSSGSSLLRHKLKEAWNHFLPQARLNGAIFFLDDLQNITSISKSDLALTIRDQFQSLGIESMNYSVCFSAKPDYFAETKGLADPAVRFYTKFYLERFTLDETLDYARSVFDLSLDTSATVAAWLHEKTLGHPFFLAFVCKYLTTTAGQIQPDKLEPIWPAIFDQLGREKFRSDVSQLSAREFEFVRRFANLSENELATQHYTGKFRREYFARLVEKGLLIRAGRGRYKLYHPLFREFLRQTK
ncbi:MAG TPA: ATP-binding protein [Candidatus Sulfotelmatobacter sp.]|nr:ATP-binding protein [Candidatus Sulfotelmatobacter sp.]